jgi:hypothetical protein
MDFGEVARCVAPEVAKQLHEAALRFLDDSATANLPQTKAALLAQLLKSDGQVIIDSDAGRRAWVDYQLALDNLAVTRKCASAGAYESKAQQAHDSFLDSARRRDPDGKLYPIYLDQLAVLDQFLPPCSSLDVR